MSYGLRCHPFYPHSLVWCLGAQPVISLKLSRNSTPKWKRYRINKTYRDAFMLGCMKWEKGGGWEVRVLMLKNDWCVMFSREVEVGAFIAMVGMGGGWGVGGFHGIGYTQWYRCLQGKCIHRTHCRIRRKLEIPFYFHSYSEVCAPGKVCTETGRNEKKIIKKKIPNSFWIWPLPPLPYVRSIVCTIPSRV